VTTEKVFVCETKEIREGQVRKFRANSELILVARKMDKYYAIGNNCSHMGGDLSKGKLNGYLIRCPVHGAVYDIRTGMLVKDISPILKIFSKAHDQRKVRLQLDGEKIFAIV
jgi:nitrite reductase/ring-hydroxylating ferredoxin subunit